MNERPVWGAAASNGNGEDERETDIRGARTQLPLLIKTELGHFHGTGMNPSRSS